MRTVGYYGGEQVQIGRHDPFDRNDPLFDFSNPDETTDAPEPANGRLFRYGNVILTEKSHMRMTCKSNESAVRVMRWARERGK